MKSNYLVWILIVAVVLGGLYLYYNSSVSAGQQGAAALTAGANNGLAIATNPQVLNGGGSVTVVWATAGYNSCTVSGPGVSATGLTGSKGSAVLTASATFVLSCSRKDGTVGKASAWVSVH